MWLPKNRRGLSQAFALPLCPPHNLTSPPPPSPNFFSPSENWHELHWARTTKEQCVAPFFLNAKSRSQTVFIPNIVPLPTLLASLQCSAHNEASHLISCPRKQCWFQRLHGTKAYVFAMPVSVLQGCKFRPQACFEPHRSSHVKGSLCGKPSLAEGLQLGTQLKVGGEWQKTAQTVPSS